MDLDQNLTNIPIDTGIRLTLNQEPLDSRPSVDQPICIDQKLVDCLNRDVDGVVNQGVDSVNRRY